jgi:hypothetical protein
MFCNDENVSYAERLYISDKAETLLLPQSSLEGKGRRT